MAVRRGTVTVAVIGLPAIECRRLLGKEIAERCHVSDKQELQMIARHMPRGELKRNLEKLKGKYGGLQDVVAARAHHVISHGDVTGQCRSCTVYSFRLLFVN